MTGGPGARTAVPSQNTFQCECDFEGFYDDWIDDFCQPCDITCATCTSFENTKCITCYSALEGGRTFVYVEDTDYDGNTF